MKYQVGELVGVVVRKNGYFQRSGKGRVVKVSDQRVTVDAAVFYGRARSFPIDSSAVYKVNQETGKIS